MLHLSLATGKQNKFMQILATALLPRQPDIKKRPPPGFAVAGNEKYKLN